MDSSHLLPPLDLLLHVPGEVGEGRVRGAEVLGRQRLHRPVAHQDADGEVARARGEDLHGGGKGLCIIALGTKKVIRARGTKAIFPGEKNVLHKYLISFGVF